MMVCPILSRVVVLCALCLGQLACGGSVVVEGEAASGAGVGGGGPDAGPSAACPIGGPEGQAPVELGPPPGGIDDLWRGLHAYDEAGEGQSFVMPRSGVIDRVTVQIFADSAAGSCELRLFRWCEGQRVLAATAQVPATAFPAYLPYPDSTIYTQDLHETDIVVSPALAVASGERVDAIFVAIQAELVSVITMANSIDDSRAVFPNGAPGLVDPESLDWDYHARLNLR